MNRIHQEEMVNNIKVQRNLSLWRMYYDVFIPKHCKIRKHPYGSFSKFMKYHPRNLHE